MSDEGSSSSFTTKQRKRTAAQAFANNETIDLDDDEPVDLNSTEPEEHEHLDSPPPPPILEQSHYTSGLQTQEQRQQPVSLSFYSDRLFHPAPGAFRADWNLEVARHRAKHQKEERAWEEAKLQAILDFVHKGWCFEDEYEEDDSVIVL